MGSSTGNVIVNRKHCKILGELWLFYRDDAAEDEAWSDFFGWADIGLPLAYMIAQELAEPTGDAAQYIKGTWQVFCEMISIDPEGEYEDIAECFETSPNPLLGQENGE